MALNTFFTAVRFLTILPVTWRAEEDPDNFSKCLVFFPAVGILIGILGYIGARVLLAVFPQEVAAALAIIYLAFISGALHLDGLADSADGLLSARPRSDSLRIMKDSRTGAMGVIAVVCILLTKFGSLIAMSPESFCTALFFMPLGGRCAILLAMAWLRYARTEGGLGGLFYSAGSRTAAIIGFLLLTVLLAILAPDLMVPTLLGIAAVTLLFGWWCRTRLGGATGDTLGATCELSETITAVCFTVSLSSL
jgi:adenosylcobinamide-GDP ribazoletransferase